MKRGIGHVENCQCGFCAQVGKYRTGYKVSPETIEKRNKTRREKHGWFKNRETTSLAMSASATGRVQTQETRDRKSIANKEVYKRKLNRGEQWHTPEGRARIIATHSGDNNPMKRLDVRMKLRGRPSPRKNKTYEEIYGVEKARELKKKTSDWMSTDRNILKYCTKITKPQRALFDKVSRVYADAVLEYPIKLFAKKLSWLDIAIPSLKIDYEYDGHYWHHIKEGAEEADSKRDKRLRELGWTVIRISNVEEFNL